MITNAKYTNEDETMMEATFNNEEPTFGIHTGHRLWRKIISARVPIADYEAPVVIKEPSFRSDLIDAITGTPAEQTEAKTRLRAQHSRSRV